ncbi:MAG TPA: tetratricopeptide repeat protein, partial [Lysobacter sp.]|nr:tetratricopeptide repeat protein [Lysobacter sp.]
MVVAAHWCGPLFAQTQQQVDACEGKGNLPLDTVISSCAALIQSGNYVGRDLSTVFVIRAIAYQRKGELDRAIQDYDQAIGLDPSGATAYYNRGVAYGSRGDWDRAIQDYDQA